MARKRSCVELGVFSPDDWEALAEGVSAYMRYMGNGQEYHGSRKGIVPSQFSVWRDDKGYFTVVEVSNICLFMRGWIAAKGIKEHG